MQRGADLSQRTFARFRRIRLRRTPVHLSSVQMAETVVCMKELGAERNPFLLHRENDAVNEGEAFHRSASSPFSRSPEPLCGVGRKSESGFLEARDVGFFVPSSCGDRPVPTGHQAGPILFSRPSRISRGTLRPPQDRGEERLIVTSPGTAGTCPGSGSRALYYGSGAETPFSGVELQSRNARDGAQHPLADSVHAFAGR